MSLVLNNLTKDGVVVSLSSLTRLADIAFSSDWLRLRDILGCVIVKDLDFGGGGGLGLGLDKLDVKLLLRLRERLW